MFKACPVKPRRTSETAVMGRQRLRVAAIPHGSVAFCVVIAVGAIVMLCLPAMRASPRTPQIDDPPTDAPEGFSVGALSTPRIVNLYWDVDWDSDTRAAGLDVMLLGQSALDGFVKALTQSRYFSGLSEYGVQHVDFDGSAFASPECRAKAPASVPRGGLAALVTCMESSGKLPGPITPMTIVNILLPPSTTSIPSTFFAYHAYRCCPPKAAIPFTVVPLHSARIRSVLPISSTFGAMMTHELVEAITNPFGKYGWRDRSIEEGEIADFCPWRAATTTPAMPFLQWSVTRYWSRQRSACVFE